MHHGVPCQVMTFKSKKWNFIGWWTLGSPLGSRLRVRLRLDPTLFFYERIKPIKLIHVIFFPLSKNSDVVSYSQWFKKYILGTNFFLMYGVHPRLSFAFKSVFCEVSQLISVHECKRKYFWPLWCQHFILSNSDIKRSSNAKLWHKSLIF